ncbi:hypothetical protein ERO13_D01G101800v2 [Gossypium hirsutum]|uniref:Thioredoxin domain-containing protein n=6 Tax=Gossypium TaxID=3633 RepID=A0A0D2QC38_GOSRA|nr:thioredoxin H1 [Gossypium raimondii]XP_016742028.1 thioredoxin H1-like [Gossypium hirsutum]KAB2044883.1 hypothetical protein ES319_D01G121100v1 [Gossypium barbadense]TYG82991.1 hypothetical protein ES288_D01G133100v1 [Gossypium darwinii]TYH87629.1 hypothetical protein ES332_D01G130500v1 [Gossypium tomentosum]TYI97208.1 hypothetical protein E1A91_D01G126800v1 [Gossypium mustelinum]KAG4162165.1 hypothetical protein ERO13_D01G101800v2 [Gossypium hirsutum]
MAEEGQVIACHTVDSWNQQLEMGNQSKKLVVVDFTASWCGPCRFISPILVDLAKKLPNVIFLKVDVDELNTVAQEWAIEAMPTFVFLKEGTIIDKVVGARKEELQQKIAFHSSNPVQTA